MATLVIKCSGAVHAATAVATPAPVIGTIEGDDLSPTAAWGYLCAECTMTLTAAMVANPTVHPRTLAQLVPRPGATDGA